jgi:hypothetical protein
MLKQQSKTITRRRTTTKLIFVETSKELLKNYLLCTVRKEAKVVELEEVAVLGQYCRAL